MQNDGKEENGQLASPLSLSLPPAKPLSASLRRDSTKNSTKTGDDQLSAGFLKVRGLPMTINESYVFDLFIGNYENIKLVSISLNICSDLMDFHTTFLGLQLNGVQMERNENGQFKGTAIVSFENVLDCQMALKLYRSPSEP